MRRRAIAIPVLLAALTSCGERPSTISGDVFLATPNADVRRFAAVPVRLVRAPDSARAAIIRACQLPMSDSAWKELVLTTVIGVGARIPLIDSTLQSAARSRALAAQTRAFERVNADSNDALKRMASDSLEAVRRGQQARFDSVLTRYTVVTARTDVAGHFSATVPPGRYAIHARAQIGDDLPQWWVLVTLKSGEAHVQNLDNVAQGDSTENCGKPGFP